MKINRAALIKACDDALQHDREAWDKQLARQLTAYDRERAAWLAMYGERWAKACLDIRAALRKGQPVTRDMLPKQRYNDVSVFTPDTRVSSEYQQPRSISALRSVLDTIADEQVTLSALERLGVDRATVRAAVQFLRAATIEGASN